MPVATAVAMSPPQSDADREHLTTAEAARAKALDVASAAAQRGHAAGACSHSAARMLPQHLNQSLCIISGSVLRSSAPENDHDCSGFRAHAHDSMRANVISVVISGRGEAWYRSRVHEVRAEDAGAPPRAEQRARTRVNR